MRWSGRSWCPGIDAATGKPVVPEKQDTAITYTDLSGSGVKADVEKLARYGVGYDGGRFQPDKAADAMGSGGPAGQFGRLLHRPGDGR